MKKEIIEAIKTYITENYIFRSIFIISISLISIFIYGYILTLAGSLNIWTALFLIIACSIHFGNGDRFYAYITSIIIWTVFGGVPGFLLGFFNTILCVYVPDEIINSFNYEFEKNRYPIHDNRDLKDLLEIAIKK